MSKIVKYPKQKLVLAIFEIYCSYNTFYKRIKLQQLLEKQRLKKKNT